MRVEKGQKVAKKNFNLMPMPLSKHPIMSAENSNFFLYLFKFFMVPNMRDRDLILRGKIVNFRAT